MPAPSTSLDWSSPPGRVQALRLVLVAASFTTALILLAAAVGFLPVTASASPGGGSTRTVRTALPQAGLGSLFALGLTYAAWKGEVVGAWTMVAALVVLTVLLAFSLSNLLLPLVGLLLVLLILWTVVEARVEDEA